MGDVVEWAKCLAWNGEMKRMMTTVAQYCKCT